MIRLAAALALLVGCEAGVVTEAEEPVAILAPEADPALVLARLEIYCHPGPHPECYAISICRECDPAIESCDAWQGECNVVEEP